MPVGRIGEEDVFRSELLFVRFHEGCPFVDILAVVFAAEVIQVVPKEDDDFVDFENLVLNGLLVGGVAKNGKLVVGDVREPASLKVGFRIGVGFRPLVPAGDVEHGDIVLPAEGYEFEGARTGGPPVFRDPLVPDSIVEEVVAVRDQVAPVFIREQQGIVYVGYYRQRLCEVLTMCQGRFDAEACYVEGLMVESSIFGGCLFPGYRVAEVVLWPVFALRLTRWGLSGCRYGDESANEGYHVLKLSDGTKGG